VHKNGGILSLTPSIAVGPADDAGNYILKGFYVDKKNKWVDWAQSHYIDPDQTAGGLSVGTHKVVFVIAHSSTGREFYSSEYKFTVVTGSLTAPQGLSAKVLDDNRVQLSWNPVKNAASYNVHRTNAADGTKKTFSKVKATTYIDLTVQPDTTYWYAVTAVSSEGQEGDWPQSITVSIPKSNIESVLAMEALKISNYTVGDAITLKGQVANYDSYAFYVEKPPFWTKQLWGVTSCATKSLHEYSFTWDTKDWAAGTYHVGIAAYNGDELTYSTTIDITLENGFQMQSVMDHPGFARYYLTGTAPGYTGVEFWYRSPDGKDHKMSEEISVNNDFLTVSWPDQHLSPGKYQVFMVGTKNGVKRKTNRLPVTLDKDNSYMINSFNQKPTYIDEGSNGVYNVFVSLKVGGNEIAAYYAQTSGSSFSGFRDYRGTWNDSEIDTSQSTWVNIESFLEASGYKLETLSNGRTLASKLGVPVSPLVYDLRVSESALLDQLLESLYRNYTITINDYDTKYLNCGQFQNQTRKRTISINYPLIGGDTNFDFKYNEGTLNIELDADMQLLNQFFGDIDAICRKAVGDIKQVTSIMCDDPSEWGAFRALCFAISGKDYTVISGPGGDYNAYFGNMSWEQWAKLIQTLRLP